MRNILAIVFSWFKRCRDSRELLLLKKFECSTSEIQTLRETLSQGEGDRESINERIKELEAGLAELPRGRNAFFFIFALVSLAAISFLVYYFGIFSELVQLNWENNPEYLMEFRATSVFIWQILQWFSENGLLVPTAIVWFLGIFLLQRRMLWFRAYNTIFIAWLLTFATLFLFLMSFSHLVFRPLL